MVRVENHFGELLCTECSTSKHESGESSPLCSSSRTSCTSPRHLAAFALPTLPLDRLQQLAARVTPRCLSDLLCRRGCFAMRSWTQPPQGHGVLPYLRRRRAQASEVYEYKHGATRLLAMRDVGEETWADEFVRLSLYVMTRVHVGTEQITCILASQLRVRRRSTRPERTPVSCCCCRCAVEHVNEQSLFFRESRRVGSTVDAATSNTSKHRTLVLSMSQTSISFTANITS